MIDSLARRSCLALVLGSFALVACGGDDTGGEAQTTATSGTGASTGGAGGSGGAGAAGGGDVGGGGAGGRGGAGGAGPCAVGSTWSLVDDLVYSPGEPSNPGPIAAGPAGELYVGGVVKQGTFRGLLRKSVDGGMSWNDLEILDPVNMSHIGGSGIVVDPAGAVFIIGGSMGERVVWKSDDGGQSVARIDAFPLSPDMNTPCNTGSIARAPDGTLYTVGSCDDTGWTVRRGGDDGTGWSTVSTFELVAGHRARSADVFVDAIGRPFVSGQAQDALDVNHWIVRSGGMDGSTWTTVDDYQLVMGAHATASALGGKSRLYALGAAATALPDFTGSHWIVRTADTVTGAWSTADDHSPSAASTSGAVGLYEDPTGTLLAVGMVNDSGANVVVTRRSDDDGASWQTIDTYSYVAGKPSAPTGMAADPAGNVYVTVRGVDASDVAHWVVRKLSCD